MNDYDDNYYIDKEPPAGSGDEDIEGVKSPADALEEARELRKRIEESIFLSKQAS